MTAAAAAAFDVPAAAFASPSSWPAGMGIGPRSPSSSSLLSAPSPFPFASPPPLPLLMSVSLDGGDLARLPRLVVVAVGATSELVLGAILQQPVSLPTNAGVVLSPLPLPEWACWEAAITVPQCVPSCALSVSLSASPPRPPPWGSLSLLQTHPCSHLPNTPPPHYHPSQ